MLLNPVRELQKPAERGNVYEFRDYRCNFQKAPAFAQALNEAMPIRERYSKCLGIWTGESPQPNQCCHLWVYKDLNARAVARAAATKDPKWQEFLGKSGPMLEAMQSIALLPASFSPLK
jgi:hypothetical protein